MSKYLSNIAVFPGSFDPFTKGHLDIVSRAVNYFENVHVAVMNNPSKTNAMFSVEERINFIKDSTSKISSKLTIGNFSGLLVDYLKENNAGVIIRGLRATSDYDYEAQMALINKKLDNNVETFFMMAGEKNSYISSSAVKQIAPLGGDLSQLVPKEVESYIKKKFDLN